MSNFKLVSCHYENFKRHEDITIDFSETLTVIRGANYKGKSSLLQGIFFALFGMRAVPGGAEVVTRKGSKKKAVVTLMFEDGTDEYTLIRTPTSANLVATNGGTIASGGTAVNEWVASRFTDIKKALLLSFSEQGDSQALLALGANKINSLIEELSGADYVDQLAKRAGDKATQAQARLDAIGDFITSPDEVEEALAAATADAARATAELEKIDRDRLGTKAKIDQLQAEVRSMEEANERARANNEKRQRLRSRLEVHTSNRDTLYSRLSGRELIELDVLKEKLVTVGNRISASAELTKKFEDLRGKRGMAQRWLENNENKYNLEIDHKGEFEEKSKKLEIENNKLVGLQAKALQAKNSLSDLKDNLRNSVCSTCKRPFDEAHRKELEAKLPACEEALEDASKKVQQQQAKAAGLSKELTELLKETPPEGWAEEIEKTKRIVESTTEELDGMDSPESMDTLRKEERKIMEEIAQGKVNNQRIKEMKEELEEFDETIAEVEEQLSTLSEMVMADSAAVQSDLRTLQSSYLESAESRSQAASKLSEFNSQTKQLNRQLVECRELWQKRLDAEATKTRYALFCKWLRDNKAAFLAETWAGVLAIVTEFTAQATAGAISEVGRDQDGDFWFREGEQVMPISAASGGQKSIVGTALRCALPSLLPAGLGFIALDEPSADLDTTHSAALAGALRAIERQVILITHREGEEYLSDSVVVLDE